MPARVLSFQSLILFFLQLSLAQLRQFEAEKEKRLAEIAALADQKTELIGKVAQAEVRRINCCCLALLSQF